MIERDPSSASEPAIAPEPATLLADEFAWLYDEDERRRIEAAGVPPSRPARGADGAADGGHDDGEPGGGDSSTAPGGLTAGGLVKRYGVLGAMGARSMLGLAQVIEPDKLKPTIIEFAPDALAEDEQLVTFLMVPGDPRASRLVIRPWLRRTRAS